MRFIKFCTLSLLSFLLFATSCEKGEVQSRSFTGKWTLKKYYSDPGNGSGRYMDVPAGSNQTIIFRSNGNVTSTTSYFGLQMLNKYEVLDTTQVKFSFSDASSQPTTTYLYHFKGDTLILNPPCYEGCGLKYVKTF